MVNKIMAALVVGLALFAIFVLILFSEEKKTSGCKSDSDCVIREVDCGDDLCFHKEEKPTTREILIGKLEDLRIIKKPEVVCLAVALPKATGCYCANNTCITRR